MALAVAAVAVACEAGVLLLLQQLGLPLGAELLPVLLLVGASAGAVGVRASMSLARGRTLVLRDLLLLGGGQVMVGLALASSGQPMWRELGIVLAGGCALALVLGVLATPGLALGKQASGKKEASP